MPLRELFILLVVSTFSLAGYQWWTEFDMVDAFGSPLVKSCSHCGCTCLESLPCPDIHATPIPCSYRCRICRRQWRETVPQ